MGQWLIPCLLSACPVGQMVPGWLHDTSGWCPKGWCWPSSAPHVVAWGWHRKWGSATSFWGWREGSARGLGWGRPCCRLGAGVIPFFWRVLGDPLLLTVLGWSPSPGGCWGDPLLLEVPNRKDNPRAKSPALTKAKCHWLQWEFAGRFRISQCGLLSAWRLKDLAYGLLQYEVNQHAGISHTL